MAKRTRPAEFMLAYDDHTWDTEEFDVPATLVKDYEKNGDARVFDPLISKWMEETRHKSVVGIYVYCIPAQEKI